MADENLFESFYRHFVLRDFVGKIVPGALVIVAFSATVPSFRDFLRCETPGQTGNAMQTIWDAPFMIWVLLVGASWLVGIAVQFLPEVLLPESVYKKLFPESVSPKTKIRDIATEERAEHTRKFLKYASLQDIRTAERSDVISEGGRNVSMAMLIALVITLLVKVRAYISAQWPNYLILFVGWLVMIVVLWKMSLYHQKFRKKYMQSVIANAEKSSNHKCTPSQKDD